MADYSESKRSGTALVKVSGDRRTGLIIGQTCLAILLGSCVLFFSIFQTPIHPSDGTNSDRLRVSISMNRGPANVVFAGNAKASRSFSQVNSIYNLVRGCCGDAEYVWPSAAASIFPASETERGHIMEYIWITYQEVLDPDAMECVVENLLSVLHPVPNGNLHREDLHVQRTIKERLVRLNPSNIGALHASGEISIYTHFLAFIGSVDRIQRLVDEYVDSREDTRSLADVTMMFHLVLAQINIGNMHEAILDHEYLLETNALYREVFGGLLDDIQTANQEEVHSL